MRLNPHIDANTHDKISTGKKGDKFGIDIDEAEEILNNILKLDNLNFLGFSTHIGSQITTIDPFRKAYRKLFAFIDEIEKKGIEIKHIDLGGGLGVFYDNQEILLPDEYGKMLQEEIKKHQNKKIIFEPGRFIMANSGLLITSVIYVKETKDKDFAVIDAAMNDLLRPALYDAKHQFSAIEQAQETEKYDFVGPVCETSDVFIKDLKFRKLTSGDLVAIRSVGAYGAVMSSEYNSRNIIPETLIDGDKFEIIKQRGDLEDLIKKEKIPKWLK